jgi:DNA gyrase/topoisomerase IV subunit B
MDAKDLRDTTLDPRQRTLLKVEIDSLLETDRTFVNLLGKDPGQRQAFVLQRSVEVALEEMDV